MTTCLFVMEDWPITPVAAGGSPALIHSHLELMAQAVDQMDLAILTNPGNSLGFQAYQQTQSEIWEKVAGWCRKVYVINVQPDDRGLSMPNRFLGGLFKPALYSYGSLLYSEGTKQLAELIRSVAPDLIWAEHLVPATLIAKIAPDCPVIYSHHDWRWKIKSHRVGDDGRNFRKRISFWFSRRHETQLVRVMTACVSGSATELEEFHNLGAERLGYFPTTYEAVDLPVSESVDKIPRIVHLGGMQATANRLGLGRFLEVCWPALVDTVSPKPDLWVVGNLDGATPELLSALKQENITCTGVIPDLQTVLRPFDIHIVPWEYDTGTRTRIPLILNHSQVLVSTRAAASCLPELENCQNCILVENLSEMTTAISALFDNVEVRERIAYQGRETYLNCFTRQAQQPRFDSFIRDISSARTAA